MDAKDTSSESATASPEPKLSSTGIAAMQGDGGDASAEKWHTGRPAELAAIESLRADEGRCMDLNSTRQGGSPNFPIYDVAGPGTVASVKHLGQDDGGQLLEGALAQYRSAFREAIGNGTDPTKFEKAAEELSRLSEEGKPVPIELRDKPLEYLRGHAQLWVPADHAYQVKDDLSRRLLSDDPIMREVTASQYNLNHNSENYSQNVADLLNRVKPLPKTSSELKDEFSRGAPRGL